MVLLEVSLDFDHATKQGILITTNEVPNLLLNAGASSDAGADRRARGDDSSALHKRKVP